MQDAGIWTSPNLGYGEIVKDTAIRQNVCMKSLNGRVCTKSYKRYMIRHGMSRNSAGICAKKHGMQYFMEVQIDIQLT